MHPADWQITMKNFTLVSFSNSPKCICNSLGRSVLLVSLTLLGACSNSLVVDGQFPQPLVKKLPLTLGVHYDQAFSQYTYVEKSEDRSKWTIENGKAQTELFDIVLPGMFERVVPLDQLPGVALADSDGSVAPGIDLVLSPLVDEFQYAMPRETKINVFEIWIKYNMRVYNADGQLIADWIMSSYGKTPTAFMKSKEEALNQAVVMAVRDIGARMSLTFQRVPEIRAWLEQHNKTMINNTRAPQT